MIHSKERIEAFSDAVFAFAATLIVVSFVIPDEFSVLRDLLKEFLSFGVSFLALALIWIVHYKYFRRIQNIDWVIVGVNMFLLFVILFYVYPLKFLSNTLIGKAHFENMEELALLFGIYGFGFALIFLCVCYLYHHSSKIETSGSRSQHLKFIRGHYFIYVVVGLLSIGLAFFQVGIRYGVPGFVYPLLGPLCYFHDKKYNKNWE